MLLNLLQGGISEISQLFLKEKLKNWWEYNKIDKEIARKIRDTCEDEEVDFDDFMERLGITESSLKQKLKELKRSFKERKSYASRQEFLDIMVQKYLELLTDSENPRIRDNPLTAEEVNLIEKMKANILVYLTNFKPVETIATIKIKLDVIEEQNKEQYENIIKKLDNISSQPELAPKDLKELQIIVESEFDRIQQKLNQVLKEIKIMRNGTKLHDSKIINEYIDMKIGFKNVEFSEDKIKVGEKYQIKIVTETQIPFQVTALKFNTKPINIQIHGEDLDSCEEEHDFYRFDLLEVVNCSVGKNLIALVNLRGPNPNFRYELYVILEGQISEDDTTYHIKKSKGPFQIDRVTELNLLGNLAVGLIDKFIDPDISKTLKKIQEESKPKYL